MVRGEIRGSGDTLGGAPNPVGGGVDPEKRSSWNYSDETAEGKRKAPEGLRGARGNRDSLLEMEGHLWMV